VAVNVEELEHIYIGNTWVKNDDGSWFLPKKTLGWQIAAWCADYLHAPLGGPWKFTLEQLRFVLWWYAVDDAGRFVYRTGVLQRMKGWGKDPLLAVLCLVELVGPSRFGGWDANGNPIGVPEMNSWVQVTAVNQAQSINTMGMLPSLMSDKFIQTYSIKAGAEVIRANGGRQRLEAVTSNYRAIEGKRTTFILMNETHHWVEGNHGHQMFETIDGNRTKIASARSLAITNAYLPGEDSVAERQRAAYDAIVEGRAADIGFYYDSVEAHPATPLTPEALQIVVPIIRGDADWLDVDKIIESIQNTQIAPARSRRMYLNQIVAEEDALYGPDQWAALMDPELMLQTGDEIVLGFDGSRTDDATALVAIRIKDCAAFLLHLEEKPPGPQGDGWHVNQERVDSAVHEAFRLYRPVAFYADVKDWESYIDDWAETYRERLIVKASGQHSVAWDMRQSLKRVTLAHERLVQAIFDGRIKHQGDKALTRHVFNVRRRPNNYGISFGKESRESPRKVDAYAALMLAHEALHDYRTRGKKETPRSGAVWSF
jgi:phage terminase large subunit-like protein